MATQIPRVRLIMDCIDGAWESLDGNQRCQFRGTVRFTTTSLAHPEILVRVIEVLIEWEQPSPAQYARVALVPVLEILFDLEEELEEVRRRILRSLHWHHRRRRSGVVDWDGYWRTAASLATSLCWSGWLIGLH